MSTLISLAAATVRKCSLLAVGKMDELDRVRDPAAVRGSNGSNHQSSSALLIFAAFSALTPSRLSQTALRSNTPDEVFGPLYPHQALIQIVCRANGPHVNAAGFPNTPSSPDALHFREVQDGIKSVLSC